MPVGPAGVPTAMPHLGRPVALLLLAALAALGCDPSPTGVESSASAGGGRDAEFAPIPAPRVAPAPSPVVDEASAQAVRLRRFVQQVDGLSEPDAEFFSDNLVSNETSFLHIAEDLPTVAPKGAAYVGVGPEQNFSYIARLDPSVAYVVDIRRDNLRLHLLYKAAFELAGSRAQLVALLLGRPAPAAGETDGDVAGVLRRATAAPATADSFAAARAALRERITSWGLRLGPAELGRIEAIHRRFFEDQLGLRFALKEANGRTYPTLEEMLSATDTGGRARGFLADRHAFDVVASLQRQHRIVPLVGDFAGDRAMPGVAAAMKRDGQTLGTFYVSNVEQYLLEPAVWARWRRNVAAFPRAEGAVFVRAWLDQGRAHPRQREGHRTATLLASIDGFEAAQRERPYGSWWAIATDAMLPTTP